MRIMNDPEIISTEDELFRETHYSRYGFERTNIYGLTLLDSRQPTCLERQPEFPSHRFDTFPIITNDNNTRPEPLKKPIRHLLSASASEVVAFVSRDGYWNSLNIGLGLEPGKTEIIAVDAIEVKEKIYLCVAVAEKQGNDEFLYNLYIFEGKAPFLEETLLYIKDISQKIPLPCPPMQISHIQTNKQEEPVFLVTAMDGQIHVFSQEKNNKKQFVESSNLTTSFPIINQINDRRIRILYMHIYDQPNGDKVICAGGQDGDIILAFYDKDGREISSYTTRIFSPITSVLIFQPRVSKKVNENDVLHLVVTCAIELAIVYKCIKKNGLAKSRVLPQSGNYDSVLCSHVMDVDWDGEHEILIGTYGRQVLIYKQVSGTQDYNILWQRQFAYPIYRISHLDLNLDGLDELIVTTMYGVHILQPNMKKARERLLEVLQHVDARKRHMYELMLEWRHQKELEKAIVFES
ncbi:hypothetical protein BDA99DRAFT_515634 [Phascolomyces articulosus]|uniref:Kaptin n=1 Tax=Phascolomyces articulosus TaxID=60185 RepID=A0AAD5JX61_9FUNG|nr:hypothetical protein BDA99DRAFT_515634 [Phascolomyces articulosus]